MNEEQRIEAQLLKMRRAVEGMRHVNACCERDQSLGGWRQDYSRELSDWQDEFTIALNALPTP